MAYLRFIFSFSLCLFLISCQETTDAVSAVKSTCPADSINEELSEIIIGSNDWIHYGQTGDSDQNANERTVAQVKIPAQYAACTGFLINANTLMTNNHCINSAAQAVNATAIFRNDSGVRETFSCNQFIMTSVVYDFTLVKCSGSPGLKYGWVGLANFKAMLGEPIYVVQENCDYISNPYCTVNKYVGFGRILTSSNARVNHDADTLGGSSGSPIFLEDTHQVIALHNAGSPASGSSPAMNAGVPMFQIRTTILQNGTVPIYEFGTAGSGGGNDSVPTPTPTPRPTSTPTPVPTLTPTPGPTSTPTPLPTLTPVPGDPLPLDNCET